MRPQGFSLAVAVWALAAAGPALPADTADAGAIDRGRTVAETHCAACHAVGKAGDSPNASAPPLRRLHEDYPVGDLIAALSEGAQPSRPGMHRFRLPARDARALIAYIQSLPR